MSHGVLIPGDRDPATFARSAEELGYGAVWMGELWGSDAFVSLARSAEATDGVLALPVVDDAVVIVPAGSGDELTNRTVEALAPDSG